MPVFVLKTCCGCVSLRTGSFIIGYILLVVYLIYLVLLILMIMGRLELCEEARLPALARPMLLAVVSAIQLYFTMALLVGLHTYKCDFVLAFLVHNSFFVVLNFGIFLTTIIGSSGVFLMTSRFGFFVMDALAFTFVRSYYHKMAESDSHTPSSPPGLI